MKKVLVIKTSSLGDVIHTLPALTDAQTVLDEIQFDWLVEENFAEIPAWHPAVRKIIPVAIRRWRKQIFKSFFSGGKDNEWQHCKQQLQQEHYDYIIDAQGLLKSALLTRFAHGESYGLDKQSAREPLAAHFYQHPQSIVKQQHAVERVRQLFAKSLGYSLNDLPLDYGIKEGIEKGIKKGIKAPQEVDNNTSRAILFLHGTTWDTKHWPEQYWIELANLVTAQGHTILLPWGNEVERQRALNIKQQCKLAQQVVVLDKQNLNELVQTMVTTDAVVAVDTGLAHLAAALDKPTIAMYGPTSPGLTGTYGNNQVHLQADYECAPCFRKQCDKTKNNIKPECYNDIKAERVMTSLNILLK